MSIRAKKGMAAGLVFCIFLSIACLLPARAEAQTPIEKVLVTTSFTPVALMEVQFITAATSTEGCYVSSITWYDQNYAVVSDYFGTDPYHLEIRLDASDGYIFAENLSAYLNNSAVDVTRDGSGSFIVLKRDYTPAIWQPTIIKHPGAETVTEGGWASFVATATYTSDYKWSLTDPSGRSLACSEIASKFPGVIVNGDGTGKIIIYDIPLEMNGWKAVCTFSGPGGSVSSNGALITVNADPAKATPSPSPTVEPSPSPAATDEPEEHEHEFSDSWSSDEQYHWHECGCGETADRAGHSLEWTETRAATRRQAGEESGLCSVCGYSATRETSYEEGAASGGVDLGTFRIILFAVLGLTAAGLVLLIVQSVRESKRRKKRRGRK